MIINKYDILLFLGSVNIDFFSLFLTQCFEVVDPAFEKVKNFSEDQIFFKIIIILKNKIFIFIIIYTQLLNTTETK